MCTIDLDVCSRCGMFQKALLDECDSTTNTQNREINKQDHEPLRQALGCQYWVNPAFVTISICHLCILEWIEDHKWIYADF